MAEVTKLEIKPNPADYGHQHYELEVVSESGRVFKSNGRAHYGRADFAYVKGATERLLAAATPQDQQEGRDG